MGWESGRRSEIRTDGRMSKEGSVQFAVQNFVVRIP